MKFRNWPLRLLSDRWQYALEVSYWIPPYADDPQENGMDNGYAIMARAFILKLERVNHNTGDVEIFPFSLTKLKLSLRERALGRVEKWNKPLPELEDHIYHFITYSS